MAKTKYDWSGKSTAVDKLPESFIGVGKEKKSKRGRK